MTIYRRGEVVYVPFRFTEGDKAKVRPAIVISTRAFNASRSDVILAGITSNISRTHFVGQLVLEQWAECGLIKPSAVSGIVQTVRENQIREAIGVLSALDQGRLDSTLRDVFGL